MTYSQALLRLGSLVIAVAAVYFFVSDEMCFFTRTGDCRPVQGLSAAALCLAGVAFAAMMFIAATQPRRGARMRNLLVAGVLFVTLFASAFVLDLVTSYADGSPTKSHERPETG